MKSENIIADKSFSFAVRIVKLYRHLRETRHESILSKQLLRSGTSIGANVKEALRGQTRADFGAKMNIALKEASETEYCIELLYKTDLLNEKEYNSIQAECRELNKILISIVKSVFNSKTT